MIDIQDLSLLKITKVREWAIFFDYGNKHYFLHEAEEMGEPIKQELFERELDSNGKYSLIPIKSIWSSEHLCFDYFKDISRPIVYKQIDKEYFAYKLTKRGFAIWTIKSKMPEEEYVDYSNSRMTVLEFRNELVKRLNNLNRYHGGMCNGREFPHVETFDVDEVYEVIDRVCDGTPEEGEIK